MKIFITGASGFIGWQLTKNLANQGNKIIVFGRRIPQELHHENVEWTVGSLSNSIEIKAAMAGCDQVYHMAGLAKMRTKNPQDFYTINVEGSENIFQSALECGVKRVVFTSTCGVFGRSLNTPICEEDIRLDPFNNDYDLSKFMAEQKAAEYNRRGLEIVIVNPPRVFGPGKMTLANSTTKFIHRIAKGGIVAIPGDGNAVSNFVFVEDIVNGHIQAMKDGHPSERYILGGHNLSYNEVVNQVSSLTGRRPLMIHVPAWVMRLGAMIDNFRCSCTGAEPTIEPDDVSRFVTHRMLSPAKAIKHFNYRITDLQESLIKTIQFLGCEVKKGLKDDSNFQISKDYNYV